MAVVEYSPSSGEDTRSSQEKGAGLRDALFAAGGIAATMLARKKIAITRGISRDIVNAGLHAESRYEKYLSSNAKAAISRFGNKRTTSREDLVKSITSVGPNLHGFVSDLFRPIPQGEELLRIARMQGHGDIGPFQYRDLGIRERSFLGTIFKGPQIVAFSPMTTTGITGHPDVGAFGGMLIDGNLHVLSDPALNRSGRYVDKIIPGVHVGLTSLWGAHAERAKRGLIDLYDFSIKPGRTEQDAVASFVKNVDLDYGAVNYSQEKLLVRRYLGHYYPTIPTRFPIHDDIRGDRVMKDVNLDKMSLDEMKQFAFELHDQRYGISTQAGADGRQNLVFQNHSGPRDPYIPSYDEFLGYKVEDVFVGESKKIRLSSASEPSGPTRDSLTFRRKLVEDTLRARQFMAREASKTKFAQLRYRAHMISERIGVGEQFMMFGGGAPQGLERFVREGAEWNYRHPGEYFSRQNMDTGAREWGYLGKGPGEAIPYTPRRYNRKGMNLGSTVNGHEGPWYITTANDSAKRWANMLSVGTLHRVGEKAFGFGTTSRPNFLTEMVREAVGAESGSWADHFIRGFGKTGRVMALGFAATYAYKFANYLSRQAIGSGPTDWAANTYVGLREGQQNLLEATHVTDMARGMENAFPGSVSSPAAYVARLSVPLVLSEMLKRKMGPKGYLLGLAAGTAFAMVTWGDITQSPEELHRIFTGEQDIPVRKGRYWLLGKTPFFGGKIAYWRQHWYPLMQSGYQNQGQLWDSETEYWAQGSPISPLMAPLLTGKMWDPYYWEKKHYADRPYPISGELFEPTMPFAWLGNMTIGKLIKPPVLMHDEYLGDEQSSISQWDRGLPPGTSAELGLSDMSGTGISSADSPQSLRYQLGMAAYTQTEQMGLTGFFANTLWSKLSGQGDFMSSQSVLQSPRRATGYERAYWEKEIGDPGAGLDEGVTEYFRRFLPHRRSNVDEYNPIPNQMPDWMPGEDYFINFRQGDPYIKVPYGEARLPGAGYESLHTLHSGVPGVYDAVDRLMILANVAPYSNEYKQYKVLAKSMTGDDTEWSSRVERAIAQREALNQEYQFLDLNPPEDVKGGVRVASSIYRHAMAAVSNMPNPFSVALMNVNVGPVPTNVSKWFPYRTPESAYQDYRLYGGDFSMWDQPVEGFVSPLVRKARSYLDKDYVPESADRRREIQEYFDKLKYIKYQNLAQLARQQGDMSLASKLSRVSRSTMASGNYHPAAAMMSIPKEEKSFYKEFSAARGEERDRILAMTPGYMHNYYKRAWNEADGSETYDIDYQTSRDTVDYFKTHYLPPPSWSGWHPDVGLEQVKLRVVKNEAFDIHKFNLWESNERQLARQPFTPSIDDINAPSNDLTMLQNIMMTNMENFGMKNNRVYVTRTPADKNSHKINIRITKDDSDDDIMASTLSGARY